MDMPIFFNCQGKGCIRFLLEHGGIGRAGKNLRKLGRVDDAIAVLMEAYHYDPRNVKVLTELGICSLNQRKFAAALKWLMQAKNISPRNSHVLTSLGMVFQVQGRIFVARKYFEEAIRNDPENPVPRFHLAGLKFS
jgi:Flp pilus assembly protein TadD